MKGETDLTTLLASMRPVLHAEACVFCSVSREAYAGLTVEPIGIFHEQEGITLILTQHQAGDPDLHFEGIWAWITLTVHSSLSAVGFLAVITTRLTQAGISVNPVSAYYHDHLFVPWEKRDQAMDVLRQLATFMP
jgi:hypothetical protein